jgi:hypothetical protein
MFLLCIAGSKSSLAIYLEQQPTEQASTSDSSIPSSSANNSSSSRPNAQLPLSSFLQTDGSRLRTPMQLNGTAGSSSSARAGGMWKVGNVLWERAADWAVVVVALIVLAASEKEPPRASESCNKNTSVPVAQAVHASILFFRKAQVDSFAV